VSIVRPIDIWLAEHVLPLERRFHAVALRICRSRDEAQELVQEAYAHLLELEG
jgi:DNA-directed RNA polymerase specialized sigma24 family protein